MIESKVHPHVSAERAELFNAHDGGSTEIEYLELIGAIVLATKPKRVLETGCSFGWGALAIAQALSANGLGLLTTIEREQQPRAQAQARLARAGLYGLALIVAADSREWLARAEPPPFGVAFFDSDLTIRADECRICLERGLLRAGALAIFHDTSQLRVLADGTPDPAGAEFRRAFGAIRPAFSGVVEFPLSRGLLLAQVG